MILFIYILSKIPKTQSVLLDRWKISSSKSWWRRSFKNDDKLLGIISRWRLYVFLLYSFFYSVFLAAAMAKEPAEISKTMRPIKKSNPFVVIKKKLHEISLNVPDFPKNESGSKEAMRSRMGHLIALSQLHLVN